MKIIVDEFNQHGLFLNRSLLIYAEVPNKGEGRMGDEA